MATTRPRLHLASGGGWHQSHLGNSRGSSGKMRAPPFTFALPASTFLRRCSCSSSSISLGLLAGRPEVAGSPPRRPRSIYTPSPWLDSPSPPDNCQCRGPAPLLSAANHGPRAISRLRALAERLRRDPPLRHSISALVRSPPPAGPMSGARGSWYSQWLVRCQRGFAPLFPRGRVGPESSARCCPGFRAVVGRPTLHLLRPPGGAGRGFLSAEPPGLQSQCLGTGAGGWLQPLR